MLYHDDDNKRYMALCGKNVSEVQEMMDKMEFRASLTKEHQRFTRRIFDELWPAAVEGGEQAWECALREIDKVIEFIHENKRSFPNHREHIEQWDALKEVAGCCNCMCSMGECKFAVCPNK